MPPDKTDIDINRRKFIKASFVLAGAFVLGKVSGLLPWTPGTKEYKNAHYGFSLMHPSDLAVSTFDEGGGASTITFQNIEKAEGFQIFIVPHEGTQTLSEARFNHDVPSGVCINVTNRSVDGAGGTAFYSENIALGATREVWVVHNNGFLYELTTHKSLDAQLDSIIQSWKFV